MIDTTLAPVSLSAIEHHQYCQRQCALIHVDGLWIRNQHTVKGDLAHRRVDSGESRIERGRTVLRSIPLWSNRLGLSGRADVVEVWANDRIVPVEYKSGVRHGDSAHLQLCAQALCLEEMLDVPVPEGFLWFGKPRTRTRVEFNAELRARTIRAIEEIRSAMAAPQLPPAQLDNRCRNCQFEPICVPQLVELDQQRLRTLIDQELHQCGS